MLPFILPMFPFLFPFFLAVILVCGQWLHDVSYQHQEARADILFSLFLLLMKAITGKSSLALQQGRAVLTERRHM